MHWSGLILYFPYALQVYGLALGTVETGPYIEYQQSIAINHNICLYRASNSLYILEDIGDLEGFILAEVDL